MDLDNLDWAALERLRAAFLQGTAGAKDYWQTETDLASYDQTFAQRIGWKWDFALDELKRRGWHPPTGPVLDWGCGSGVAGRAYLDHFGADSVTRLELFDRSPRATEFARRRAMEHFPGLEVQIGAADGSSFGVLLVSHVLTELSDRGLEELLCLAGRATSILWVEPGTFETSRKLIGAREHLRDQFNVVSPCPHQRLCGMCTSTNSEHWCHQFARPPAEIFADSHWTRFGKLAGIDLRSLPLSYLVLDKRSLPELPAGTVRVIGRPQWYKPHAVLLGCAAEGVKERRLTRRAFPERFRQLRKGEIPGLQVWKCAGDEIVHIHSVAPGASETGLSPLNPGELTGAA
jgi:hypothetical protein